MNMSSFVNDSTDQETRVEGSEVSSQQYNFEEETTRLEALTVGLVYSTTDPFDSDSENEEENDQYVFLHTSSRSSTSTSGGGQSLGSSEASSTNSQPAFSFGIGE